MLLPLLLDEVLLSRMSRRHWEAHAAGGVLRNRGGVPATLLLLLLPLAEIGPLQLHHCSISLPRVPCCNHRLPLLLLLLLLLSLWRIHRQPSLLVLLL